MLCLVEAIVQRMENYIVCHRYARRGEAGAVPLNEHVIIMGCTQGEPSEQVRSTERAPVLYTDEGFEVLLRTSESRSLVLYVIHR